MITLATLKDATEQEVFDQAVNHMLTQNQKSLIDGKCKYRSGNLKCAAGCFISDEEYKPEMDRELPISWFRLVSSNLVPKDHDYLILRLQRIHDQQDVDKWKERLSEFAKENNLKFNPPVVID